MNIARQFRVDCRASSRDVISVAVNYFFQRIIAHGMRQNTKTTIWYQTKA